MKVRFIIDDMATAAPWMGFGRSQAAKMAANGVQRRHFPLGDVTVDIRVFDRANAQVRISGGSSTFAVWPFLQLPARRGGALLTSAAGGSPGWLQGTSAGGWADMTSSGVLPAAPNFWAAARPPVLTPIDHSEQEYLNFGDGQRWRMERVADGSGGRGPPAIIDISADGTQLVGMVATGSFSSSATFFTADITGDVDSGYTAFGTGDLPRTVLNSGFSAAGRADITAAITAPGALWGTPFDATVTVDGVTHVLHSWDARMDGEAGACTFYTLWADARAGVAVIQVELLDVKVVSPPSTEAVNSTFSRTYFIAGGGKTLLEEVESGSGLINNGSLTPLPIVVQAGPAATGGPDGSPLVTFAPRAQFVADPTTKKYIGVWNGSAGGTRFYGAGLETALLAYWKVHGGAGVAADIEADNVADYRFYLGDPQNQLLVPLRYLRPSLSFRA